MPAQNSRPRHGRSFLQRQGVVVPALVVGADGGARPSAVVDQVDALTGAQICGQGLCLDMSEDPSQPTARGLSAKMNLLAVAGGGRSDGALEIAAAGADIIDQTHAARIGCLRQGCFLFPPSLRSLSSYSIFAEIVAGEDSGSRRAEIRASRSRRDVRDATFKVYTRSLI